MLLVDRFIPYCKNFNNNIGAATEYAIAMQKKYPAGLFPLLAHQLRQTFTTNTVDDYGAGCNEGVLHPQRLVYQHPFFDMMNLIYADKKLMSNFFDDMRLDYLYKQNPKFVPGQEPDLLLNLLIWSQFDEKAYLRQKATQQLRHHEETQALRLAAEKYKRHLQVVENGKQAMAKIAKDPKLSKRFLAGSTLTKQISKKQNEDFIKGQMEKLKNSPLLRARFMTNITK